MSSVRRDDRVAHARFGPGVVIEVDERYTVVEFDDAGVRRFVSHMLQVEPSTLPRPTKPALLARPRRRPRTGGLASATKQNKG